MCQAVRETTYSYDASGKRLVQSTSGSDRTFNYTAGYQLDTVVETGETENYDYDQNGRLTLIQRDGKTLDLNHDSYDRLTSVENETTGETTQYIYNGAGNRIKAVEGNQERRFLVAPAMGGGLESTDLITDGSGNLISNYIYGGGSSPFMRLDANGNAVYYLTDAMGTVIGLADDDGASAGSFLYDAFGNILNGSNLDTSTGGDFRFQGQWLEDSGLYNFRARDYDPATGLFLSRDPVDIIETEPESFNPYQFVYNNPYIYSDPTGMITISEISAARALQDGLNALRTYGITEARQRLTQKVSEAIGNAALNALQRFMPFPVPAGAEILLKDAKKAGEWFEDAIKENVCELLPFDTSQLFLEVGVTQEGQPYSSGFTCSVYELQGNQRKAEINRISKLGARRGTGRPDFIVTSPGSIPRVSRDNGRTLVSGGPRPSWIIGDIKLSMKTLYNDYVGSSRYPANKPEQWNAIMNYASRNGFNVAGFITLFGEGQNFQHYRQKLIEKALEPRQGRFSSFTSIGVGLLIATIFQNAKSPFR